jgi:hypothetical protein
MKPNPVEPEGLYPPEVKTPKERFEFLGRRLFQVKPEDLKKQETQRDDKRQRRTSCDPRDP